MYGSDRYPGYPEYDHWSAGDLALFHDRLATVTAVDGARRPAILELTDAGGLTWNYISFDIDEVRPISKDPFEVLDTIVKTTRPELSLTTQRARLAELWFADPQVGDVFGLGVRFYLKIQELRADESVVCELRSFNDFDGTWNTETAIYKTADDLRNAFRLKMRPRYSLISCSSDRKEEEVVT